MINDLSEPYLALRTCFFSVRKVKQKVDKVDSLIRLVNKIVILFIIREAFLKQVTGHVSSLPLMTCTMCVYASVFCVSLCVFPFV